MSGPAAAARQRILRLESLRMHFALSKGAFRASAERVKAVDDVTLDVYRGETLGVVGESGCGKTTLGRCVVRIYEPTAGRILYTGPSGREVDLARLDEAQLKPYRRDIRMIFQDPYLSLNPRLPIIEIIGEALRVNGIARGRELEDRVVALMAKVGLRPEYLRRYPHAFSGGERQRIGIARALSTDPRLVIADEPLSALDVSIQAQTINLLEELQRELSLTYMFIAHNLNVVQHVSDRVLVMYVGRMVEVAETPRLFAAPRHPYTEALLSAVPIPDPARRDERKRVLLRGEVADASSLPAGCPFHPRCAYAVDRCSVEAPALREIEPGHFVTCHRAGELSLRGV